MYLRLTLIIVVPVLVVGIFLVRYSCTTLFNQSIQQIESDNLRVKSILVDCFISTYNIADEIYNDRLLQEHLMGKYPEGAASSFPQSSYSRIHTILAKNTSISSIHIYTTNPNINDHYYLSHATKEIINECFLKANVPSSTIWGIYPSVNRDKDNPELTLISTFPLEDSAYPAILVTTISSNYLRNRIQNNNLSTMLSVNTSNIFFSTIRSLQETPMPVTIDFNKKYFNEKGIFSYRDENKLGCISALPIYNSEDTLYLYTLDLAAYQQIVTVGLSSGLITLMVIAVALAGILIYTAYLSNRIVSLKTSMKVARDGNYDDIIDSLKGDDELTETFKDLKTLIEDIKKKDAKMYKAQLKEQEFITEQSKMEFKLLTNQINPHFIYNTLETIRMLALEADAKEVASATMLLAKSMHYVLENAMVYSTTLDKELDYINVYLQIQKIRFENRLEYSISIDEQMDVTGCHILPLLLQPIVENAIVHGLESIKQKVLVDITINKKTDTVMIININDNGKGIASQELESLNHKLNQKGETVHSSIGLYNIRSRIKLFYGEEYDLKIASYTGKGTNVSLILPIIMSIEE